MWSGDAARAFEWIEYAFERSPLGIERRILESEMFDNLRGVREHAERLDQLTEEIWSRVEMRSLPSSRPLRRAPRHDLRLAPVHGLRGSAPVQMSVDESTPALVRVRQVLDCCMLVG